MSQPNREENVRVEACLQRLLLTLEETAFERFISRHILCGSPEGGWPAVCSKIAEYAHDAIRNLDDTFQNKASPTFDGSL